VGPVALLMRNLRRRSILAGAASYLALFALHRADAGVSYAPSPGLVLPPPGFTIPVDIDFPQSWGTNTFDTFANFGLTQAGDGYSFSLNPQEQTLLTPKIANIGPPTYGPGPLPNSAGINLTGPPIGITHYTAADQVTIGRCAIMGEQYRRLQLGITPLVPILQFCAGYPSSGWDIGPGGGLGPGSVFVGSVTADVLTVSSMVSGSVVIGQMLVLPGVAANTFILSQTSGTPGGAGVYQTAVSQTVLSETMAVGSTVVVASIGAAAPSNVMTVTEVVSGTIVVGANISGVSVASGSKVHAQLSGTTGGAGTYQVLIGSQQTFASQQMNGNGVSWQNMLTILSGLSTQFPATLYPYESLTGYVVRCVTATFAFTPTNTPGALSAAYTLMTQTFDALNLPGTSTNPLHYFIAQRAGLSIDTDLTAIYAYMDQYNFCRANANGRCWGTTPWYQWPFAGPAEPSYGDIHTGPYGTARHGEFQGYAKSVVFDEGLGYFTPLWQSLTNPITRSGQVITVPFDRPSGEGFASGTLAWMSTPTDGIKVWPQYGWNVYRNGVALTVTPTISGMDVLLTITETINAGDELEVSYAMYGPGGTNPGLCSGVGGNLMMAGPPSLMFPGQTVNAWAWQFVEDITA
jgi:hypothetical protein